MTTIKVPKEILTKARRFANRVYKEKAKNKDKFLDGKEEVADFLGFFLEFAVCNHFGKPFPKFFKGKQVDDFDIELNDMKIDIKNSKLCYINKEQFDRKKGKVDAFLFGSDYLLAFEQDMIFAKLFGWIKYENVVKNSELITFKNGSQAYKVNKRKLKKTEVLK